ncbi:MAG TPA: hypothetical protein VFE24_08495 [Pirellulales bacterium]|jgi:hypothetical protein|nr:hypothetical protein [Pirellulales bacterium]
MNRAQFSLKRLLQIVGLCVVPALIGAQAARGVSWAESALFLFGGVVGTLAAAMLCMALMAAILYLFLFLFSTPPATLQPLMPRTPPPSRAEPATAAE